MAGIKVPNGITPVYDKNVMAIPRTWGSTGDLKPYYAAKAISELYRRAVHGVAFVVDSNRVLSKINTGLLEKEVASMVESWYGEEMSLAEEYYEGQPNAPEADRAHAKYQALQNLKVKLTSIVSPTSGLPGWKVQFSIPIERLETLA